MSSNVILFGWNRSIPGREQMSAEHFSDFMQYVAGLQQAGQIASFEPILLEMHGGDLNGFFLIRGDGAQLEAMVASDAWVAHTLRAGLHLEGAGVIRGASGELVLQRMGQWAQIIPP